MTTIKAIWECMFSPRLIKIYGNGPPERYYQPTQLEKWGDQVINSLYIIWKLGMYTSPIIVGILYQRGYFTADGLVTLTKFVTSIGVILVVSYCFRGMGRASNSTYQQFMHSLKRAERELTVENKKGIARYEFDFEAWPVEFNVSEVIHDKSKSLVSISQPLFYNNIVHNMVYLPLRIMALVAIHTFGIRLIYPGSIGFLQSILAPALLQGRSKLVETHKGERFKIRTRDNNNIDIMFLDRRLATQNGNTLVICCEGNAGFYEIGIMLTPLEVGFSVLGWNHPGFSGSTGTPYPSQEQNAIDGVMQFAINKLGFKPENIVIFAWSIGGYSATWAAMNYPDVKGVILDATFDDVLPLALNQMPSWLEPIVNIAIRDYANLNVFEQLANYPGPVLLIRRTEDEVICTRVNDLSSNRGNHLLIKLLCNRYPFVFDKAQIHLIHEYLADANKSDQVLLKYDVKEEICYSLLQSYISEYSKIYPLKIGEEFNVQEKNQMALYLASKYLKDFRSTHCTNLPSEMFRLPWDVNVESDFVFT